jgi:hypothetical protein
MERRRIPGRLERGCNLPYLQKGEILNERMKREIEEKGVISDSQAGFRNRRGSMDNVYILDHLIKNELKKKGRRICVLFVDFRAVFDKGDRERKE